MRTTDQVRALFRAGQTIQVVTATYQPEQSNTQRQITTIGARVATCDILTGPWSGKTGFRMQLPTRAGDVLELTATGVTYKIGRGEHTITLSTVLRAATPGVLDVHDGVLMPAEMHSASDGERDRYAAQVKKTNGAAVAEYFALQGAAAAAGIGVDRLDRAAGRTG